MNIMTRAIVVVVVGVAVVNSLDEHYSSRVPLEVLQEELR